MLGKTIVAFGLLINEWWYRVFFTIIIGTLFWWACQFIDAYVNHQMHYWSQNLGM